MQIGKLKHKISIQEKTKVDDGLGSWSETWTEFIGPRAAIWPVSASEQVKNQQLDHQVTIKVRIRYQPGIDTEMRIDYNGRILEIESMINIDEENKVIDFLCSESS